MKKTLGAKTFLYPMPTVLVGAEVDGKPNYLTVAFCGIVHYKPPLIVVALGKSHYTNQGIKANGTFSVNIPSEDMVEIVDYCGIISGREFDKSSLFETFYGTLETAPMIADCPLNLECKLFHTIDFDGSNDIFIGEIVETYVDEKCLTNDLPDITKLKPILFSMYDNNYWKVGGYLGKAWEIGKECKPKE
jgi:flavin reductase (DIM6/NTAB) family NADH-FMN oxidoreductase RutF